ncbi:apolipoprotein N-acyltransferase [Agromyces sp. MMS24-JH15]|uniref:apolipoprotein N-acyltransferase n=1 Tax=Agromyces sp. MMS24-JH15 TaxID=3243765 RepID=UPI00374A6589
MPWWVALPIAAFGGVVYDLAFPEVGIWPLAIVGSAIALATLVGRSIGGSLLVGFAFGAAFYLVHVDWTSRYLGPVPWLALSFLEAAFVAGGAVLITLAYRWVPRAWPWGWVRAVALPAIVAGLWIVRETASGTLPYGGFPWGRAALSQSESPFAEVVSWVGSSGLGFVLVWIAAMALEWVRARRWRDLPGLVPVVLVTAAAMLVPAWSTTGGGTMRVASVQGNGPAGYFDERGPGDIFRSQLEATEPILDESGVDVLLWPEGSVADADVRPGTAAADELDRVTAELDAPLIMNGVTQRGDEFFNTSMLWVSGDGVVDSYDKRHPVPFGEYIPDRDFYYALAPDLIGLVQRGYSPGTNPPVFDVGDAVVGLAICFDVIYDDLIWEGARDGAEVYLLQTNNADFRGTDENLQQLAIARLRAIETGRTVVNLSTVGTSQVIDPAGRTIDGLPADEPGAMVTDVELRTGLTPAVVLGEWVPSGILVLSLGALVAAGLLARRRAGASGSGAVAAGDGDDARADGAGGDAADGGRAQA